MNENQQEPQETIESESLYIKSKLTTVTPLSKYSAMALFILLPFIGGWIGYTYGPEKVVEVEKIIFVEDDSNKQSTEDIKTDYVTSQKENLRVSSAPDDIDMQNDLSNKASKISLLEPENLYNELELDQPIVGFNIVIGYEWISDPDSPNFASVQLPFWGMLEFEDFTDREYTVEIWNDDNYSFFKTGTLLEEVIFPDDGVQRFKVTGINTDLRICPGDKSKYTWGLKFSSDGIFRGKRIPILKDTSLENQKCSTDL
jgi:hypothetical protein